MIPVISDVPVIDVAEVREDHVDPLFPHLEDIEVRLLPVEPDPWVEATDARLCEAGWQLLELDPMF